MPPEEELPFHDITSAAEFQPSAEFPLLFIIGGVLALIVIATFLFLYFRSRSAPEISTPNKIAQALDDLATLRKNTSLTAPQAASELSLLIRKAITSTTKDDCAYQSQQEFHKAPPLDLPDSLLQEEFSQHLNDLWMLEYRKSSQDLSEMQNHFATSESLLRKLQPAPTQLP